MPNKMRRASSEPSRSQPTARMPVEAGSDEYNMNHRRRGVAVIFNHDKFDDDDLVDRTGSSVDVKILEDTFSLLGFEIKVHPNLTRSEITGQLKSLAKMDFNDCDCFCMIVMSHGGAAELMQARDATYRMSELWEPFSSERCLSLAGKPKLFFIQACRGEQRDTNTLLVKNGEPFGTEIEGCQNNWSYTIPSRVDFLMSHSTCAGFVSYREPCDGSWYIQSLCRVLTADHETTDLLTMLTTVHRRVVTEFESFIEGRPDLSGAKATPSFTSTLMRKLYFHPKPKPGEVTLSSAQAEEGEPEAE